MDDNARLASIDAKLGALLALAIDARLGGSEQADRRRARSIEALLRDAGLATPAIAKLVGKSDRRVQQILEST
jgi:hypothetical protein